MSLTTVAILFAGMEIAFRISAFEISNEGVYGFYVDNNTPSYEILPDSPLFWRPRPGVTLSSMGGDYTVNQLGFRGKATELPFPDSDKIRILCLGDSVTFGINIPDGQQTYPDQLQEKLGNGYQVFNLGRPGYTSHQGKSVLEKYRARFNPDIVVVAFGWNDALNGPTPDSRRRGAKSWVAQASWIVGTQKFLSRSKTYCLLRDLALWRPSEERIRVSALEFRENLIAMARANERTIYLTLPWSPCNNDECRLMILEDRHKQYNEIIRSLSDYGKIVDLEKLFRQCGDDCLFNAFYTPSGSIDPIHPNQLGARWISSAVAYAIVHRHQLMPTHL